MTADKAHALFPPIRRLSPIAAYHTVLRARAKFDTRPWPALLWALALFGLFLLPVNYRAGAEQPHAHALFQLWADAADGSVHHHAHPGVDWLDPAVGELADTGTGAASPDLGEQQDSAPAVSGYHLLLVAMILLPAAAVTRASVPGMVHHLAGRVPRIPAPPPRWSFAA